MATKAQIDKVLRLVAEQQVTTGEHVSRRFVHHRLRNFSASLIDEALAVGCRGAELRSHGFPPSDAFQVCPAGIERCGPVGGRIAAFIEGVLRFYKAKSDQNPDFPGFTWLELATFLRLDPVVDYNFGIAALNIAEIAGSGTGSPAQQDASYERPRDIIAFLRCSEFTEYLQLFSPNASGPTPTVIRPRPARSEPEGREPLGEGGGQRLRFLAVGTEWDSAKGGLSTLNRQLCIALSAAGHEVVCAVTAASSDEHARASALGVTLAAQPKRPPAKRGVLFRRPNLPDGFVPDFVLGHGRVTGAEAMMLSEDHFPRARRIHFLHMAPDEIEWLKSGEEREDEEDAGTRAENRTLLEVDLARQAHRVVAIGPRLQGRFAMELAAHGLAAPLRMDPGFDSSLYESRSPPPGAPVRVLVLGRAEDARLKGLDLAARAVGVAATQLGTDVNVELVVRGAPEGTTERLQATLQSWAASPNLSIVPRPYTADASKVESDLAGASLLLMPSRTEGFGLVGLEAIVAGTPALVSMESGLGRMLDEVGTAPVEAMVLATAGDEAVEAWAAAIVDVLRDRDGAFRRADGLRVRLAAAKSWERAVSEFVAAITSGATGSGSSAARPSGAPPPLAAADPRREQDVSALRTLLGNVSVSTVTDHVGEAANGRIDSVVFFAADWFDEYRRDPLFHLHDPHLLRLTDEFREALGETLNKSQWFSDSSNPRIHKFSKVDEFNSYDEWEGAWAAFSATVKRCESALRAFLAYVRGEYPEVDVVALDATALDRARLRREQARAAPD